MRANVFAIFMVLALGVFLISEAFAQFYVIPVRTDRVALDDAGEFYLPYAPATVESLLAFSICNPSDEGADIVVEYFGNDGMPLNQESLNIPAGKRTSFMSSLYRPAGGWARITSSQSIQGLALAFGMGSDPMYGMDFKATTSASLLAVHVDTGPGWSSTAMLANPNSVPADVTLALTPSGGGSIQTASLSIPAMGAVQYDLSAVFPSITGTLDIDSSQGIVGFLLLDGRGTGFNYLTALSMVPLD